MQSTAARLATIAALAWSASSAIAQSVTPPPLPPGSNLVRPSAGLNEDERKRYVRAHHHKMHHKKDMTHDDSVAAAGEPGNGPAAAAAGAQGSGGAAMGSGAGAGARSGGDLGGAGTGPKREKTDKGASSYFYGNNKK